MSALSIESPPSSPIPSSSGSGAVGVSSIVISGGQSSGIGNGGINNIIGGGGNHNSHSGGSSLVSYFMVNACAVLRMIRWTRSSSSPSQSSAWLTRAVIGGCAVFLVVTGLWITRRSTYHADNGLETLRAGHHTSFWGMGAGSVPVTSERVPRYHIAVDDLAFGINTVVADKGRHERNFQRIFSVWSAGEDLPYVYWLGEEAWMTPGGGDGVPPVHQVLTGRNKPVPQWQERWVNSLRRLVELAPADSHWYILGDDDTWIFVDPLIAALQKYDPEGAWYLGNTSEDLWIADNQLTRVGMGGGAVALSRGLVKMLVGPTPHAHDLTSCLDRYSSLFGGDFKLSLCVADVGGIFVRESGFHQLDLGIAQASSTEAGEGAVFEGRSSLSESYNGYLEYAVSKQPVISLHHMYVPPPVYRSEPSSVGTGAESPQSSSPSVGSKRRLDREEGEEEMAEEDGLNRPSADGSRRRLAADEEEKEDSPASSLLIGREAWNGKLGAMARLFTAYRSYEPAMFLALRYAYQKYKPFPHASQGEFEYSIEGVTIAINIGLSIRVWPRVVPGSFFQKLVPRTFSPVNTTVGAVRYGSGFDFDTRPPDHPCSYVLFEWVSDLGDKDTDDGGVYARVSPKQQGCTEAAQAHITSTTSEGVPMPSSAPSARRGAQSSLALSSSDDDGGEGSPADAAAALGTPDRELLGIDAVPDIRVIEARYAACYKDGRGAGASIPVNIVDDSGNLAAGPPIAFQGAPDSNSGLQRAVVQACRDTTLHVYPAGYQQDFTGRRR